MYQQPGYNFGRPAAAVSVPALLGQVLGITGVGFLITAATAYFMPDVSYGISLGAMLLGFVLIFAINGTRANAQLSLMLFYLFTAVQGVALTPIIRHYIEAAGPEVVWQAAGTTGVGMLVLGGIAWISSFDFRKLSLIAFGMLIALVLIGIVGLFVSFIHPTTYAWATLVVFSLLVLIDFQRIRAGGDGQTAVQLAVSIYLDAVNIFLALLRIFGGRGRN